MKSTAVIVALGAGLLFPSVLSNAQVVMEAYSGAAPVPEWTERPDMSGGSRTDRRPSPLFPGTALPTPPRQNARWTPPASDLPTNDVTATRLLFEQGMADPRGCEYRVIEVGTGDVWTGDGGVETTHGWLLPGQGPGRFAVCWNGLTYPVVTWGTNADLAADVAEMMARGRPGWAAAMAEKRSAAVISLLGIKGCLLLRLGRADLAEHYWQAQMRQGSLYGMGRSAPRQNNQRTNPLSTSGEPRLPDEDPYLEWATEWAWAMFDRAVCAHERGDEVLALLTVCQLTDAQPKIESACAERGFAKQSSWNGRGPGTPRPYLDFLGQLPQLRADLERRAKEGQRISVVPDGLARLTNQVERISALIRDLDLAQAHQWGQPGWVNLTDDATMVALIQEGDAAVEPLLECAEHDRRLTRSVGFGRDFSRGRTIIPVSGAATAGLATILQADFGDNVAAARAYWNQYHHLKLEDRWYAILGDDTARSRWLEAAAHIVQRHTMMTYPGGLTSINDSTTNTGVPMRGEVLRGKASPSVSELMARRALDVPAENPGAYDISAAAQMGLCLAAWDETAALPVLEKLTDRCYAVLKYSQARSDQNLGDTLAKLSIARARAGDGSAFKDYAAWLPATSPAQLEFSLAACLEPLKQFPSDVILDVAAEHMFGDTNSAWSQLPWLGSGLVNPASSTLVRVPAFRGLLARELDRKGVCGTLTWVAPNMIAYSVQTKGLNGSCGYSFPEAAQTSNGTSVPLRWCDWIAISLAQGKYIARFNPFASEEKRDAIIADAKDWLLRP